MGVEATHQFDVRLATSNPGKLTQFKRQARGVTASATEVLFNEAAIKENIHATGFEEVALISRGKFREQRAQLQKHEGNVNDYEVIVSDSVIMIPQLEQDGSMTYQAVHRDLSENQRVLLLEEINKRGEFMFVGAVTFGRKNGESSFTTLTYCSCPISPSDPLTSLPIHMEQLSKLAAKTEKPFEVGFIECVEENGKFTYKKKPKAQTFVFENEGQVSDKIVEARPYISGLTKEIINLAEASGIADRDITPLIQQLIEKQPFNTLAYHALWVQKGKPDLPSFYNELIQKREEFFKKKGGNCSLFTLHLADHLREMGIPFQVLLYPSSAKGGDKDGHSALLFRRENTTFFADPGLTIPWVIPIDPEIPILPFEKIGDKLVLVQVGDQTGDLLPDITILGKKGLQLFEAKEIVTPEVFLNRLPTILARLHESRKEIKFDLHSGLGDKLIHVSIDRATLNITLGVREEKAVVRIDDLLNNNNGLLTSFLIACASQNINGQSIIEEIRLITDHEE